MIEHGNVQWPAHIAHTHTHQQKHIHETVINSPAKDVHDVLFSSLCNITKASSAEALCHAKRLQMWAN